MVRTWWRLPALALPLLRAACASPGRGTGGPGAVNATCPVLPAPTPSFG